MGTEDNNKCECAEKKAAMMEAVKKVEYDRYQFMACLALRLLGTCTKYDDYEKQCVACDKDEHIWITFDSLKSIMNERGFTYSEGGNRGLASAVRTAQTYYGQAREDADSDEEKQSLEYIRHAIAVSFRNKDGDISYDPEKTDEKIILKS